MDIQDRGSVSHTLADTPTIPFETFVSVSTVADYLNLHKKTILRIIDDGELPAARFRNQYRIAPQHLQDYVNRMYS